MNAINLCAALAALLFLVLTFRTIALRTRFRVSIGDGGHEALKRAVRAHANFAEYTPIALVLLYAVATSGGGDVLLGYLGASLLLGRALHALGVSQLREPLVFRQIGMLLTTGVLVVSAGWLLVHSVPIGT